MLVHLYRVAIKFPCINGPMILSTCSGEGADPIGPGGWFQCVEHWLMVPLFGEGRVYVQYFMGTTCSVRAASPLASYLYCGG